MALTEEEVKKLEEEANLARRRNIAAANLADARDISGKQRAYNQMRAESDMAAHERFMERRRAFAERNPLAVPGEERRRLQLQADRGSLRAHEMGMLDKRNEGALSVAEENRWAAREQGMEAAKATAEANIKLGEINKGIKDAELELARQKLAQEKELETLKGKNTIDAINAQNKGSETVETIRGESNVKVATEQAKGNLAREQLKRDLKREEIAGKIQAQIVKNNGSIDAAKIRAGAEVIENALATGMANGKSATEVMNELKTTYKDNPDMLQFIGIYSTETSGGGTNRFKVQ